MQTSHGRRYSVFKIASLHVSLASQFQTTPTWVTNSVTHNGEERVLEVIRAGFWLVRPYSRRLVRRSMLPLLLVWTPRPCCPRSFRRSWDPDYIISAWELILILSFHQVVNILINWLRSFPELAEPLLVRNVRVEASRSMNATMDHLARTSAQKYTD